MPRYWKRKVLTLKTEGTPGTDSTPSASSNAVIARNVRLTPLEQEGEERELDVSYVGHKGRILAGAMVKLAFDVELAGSGTAGTAPRYGDAIKACGFSETVVADTSVTYAPVNPGSETPCTIYLFIDGKRWKMLYSLGNMELTLPRGKIPLLSFSMQGIYAACADVSFPSPTYAAAKPLAVTNANTPTCSLHSYSGKFSEVKVATGNALVYRNLIGAESMRLVDRKMTGSVKLEDELVATKGWEAIMRAGTTGALSVVHGATAGNIVTVGAPYCQLDAPSVDGEDNIGMNGMNLMLLPSASGNDEFSLAFT